MKGALTWKAGYEAKQGLDYDANYREFLEECRKAFESLPRTIALSKASFAFEIEIRNEGSIPASGAMVEFDAYGQLLVDRTDWMLNYKLRIPKAPEVPVAFLSTPQGLESFGGFANPMDQVLGRMARMNRDPLGVYWEEEPLATKFKQGELRCEEFRHGEAHPVSLFGFFWEFPDSGLTKHYPVGLHRRYHVKALAKKESDAFGIAHLEATAERADGRRDMGFAPGRTLRPPRRWLERSILPRNPRLKGGIPNLSGL